MKITKVTLLMIFLICPILSQNIQIHYDLGKDRKYFTSTFEMLKADDYGSTFFFADFDFNNGGNKSMSLAYFEIARYINLPWVENLSVTLQYNDGNAAGYPLGHVWLAGLSYPIDLGITTLNTDLLYRKDYLSTGSDFQITIVWFNEFWDGKIIFTGFADLWSAKLAGKDKKDLVIMTEPQLWVKVTQNLFLGSEVEITHNFLPTNKIEIMPTLAAKWEF